MGRTPEEPMPIEETYRDILRAAVASAGGQKTAAELAEVDQATISRTLKREGRATYTTLARLSRVLPGVPAPMVSVRDAAHEHWCRAGARLAASKPSLFGTLLHAALEALEIPTLPPNTAAIERLKEVVSDPNVAKSGQRRRR